MSASSRDERPEVADDAPASEREPAAHAGRKRRRSEASQDDMTVRVLGNVPQLRSYKKDARGRRGGVAVTQHDLIDALADTFAVTSTLLPPQAQPPSPESDEDILSYSDVEADAALKRALLSELKDGPAAAKSAGKRNATRAQPKKVPPPPPPLPAEQAQEQRGSLLQELLEDLLPPPPPPQRGSAVERREEVLPPPHAEEVHEAEAEL